MAIFSDLHEWLNMMHNSIWYKTNFKDAMFGVFPKK